MRALRPLSAESTRQFCKRRASRVIAPSTSDENSRMIENSRCQAILEERNRARNAARTRLAGASVRTNRIHVYKTGVINASSTLRYHRANDYLLRNIYPVSHRVRAHYRHRVINMPRVKNRFYCRGTRSHTHVPTYMRAFSRAYFLSRAS